MRKVLNLLIVFGLLVGSNAFALKEGSCKPSVCINDKYLQIAVTKVSKRGKVMIIQLNYTGKSKYIRGVDVNFTEKGKAVGYATILDAEGNEFTVSGEKIPSFSLKLQQKKNLSLKFRGKIKEPFDLTIKAKGGHGEISFFDLKSK